MMAGMAVKVAFKSIDVRGPEPAQKPQPDIRQPKCCHPANRLPTSA